MKLMKPCGGLTAASLTAWLLLMPPFSVSPAGKTVVDTQASLANWEVFSRHKNDAECRKHRDDLRSQLEKAIGSAKEPSPEPTKTPDKGAKAPAKTEKKAGPFAALKERAAAARCVASDDARMRAPASSPTSSGHK